MQFGASHCNSEFENKKRAVRATLYNFYKVMKNYRKGREGGKIIKKIILLLQFVAIY